MIKLLLTIKCSQWWTQYLTCVDQPPLLSPPRSLSHKWACLRVSTRRVSGDRHLYLPGRRGTTVSYFHTVPWAQQLQAARAITQVSSFSCKYAFSHTEILGSRANTCCSRSTEPCVMQRALVRNKQMGRCDSPPQIGEKPLRFSVSITSANGPFRFCTRSKKFWPPVTGPERQQLWRTSCLAQASGIKETRSQ